MDFSAGFRFSGHGMAGAYRMRPYKGTRVITQGRIPYPPAAAYASSNIP